MLIFSPRRIRARAPGTDTEASESDHSDLALSKPLVLQADPSRRTAQSEPVNRPRNPISYTKYSIIDPETLFELLRPEPLDREAKSLIEQQ